MFHEYTKEELAKKSKVEAERIAYLATSYGRFWDRIQKFRYAFGDAAIFAYTDELRDKKIIGKGSKPRSKEETAKSLRRLRRLEKTAIFKGYCVHGFWWFVHNCVAHPMIGLCPIKSFFEFHDYTSNKINLK